MTNSNISQSHKVSKPSLMTLIVAQSLNHVIGQNGKLPWHIPEDLAFFKKETLKSQLIMGRITWESFDVPLPDRVSIVLSKSTAKKLNSNSSNIKVVQSPEEAIDCLDPKLNTFIIGGVEIYKSFMPYATRIYLSLIKDIYEGDTKFNILDFMEVKKWSLKNKMALSEKVEVFHFSRTAF